MIHTANEFTKIHHRHLLSGYAAGLHPLPAGSVVEAPTLPHRSTRSATAQQQQVSSWRQVDNRTIALCAVPDLCIAAQARSQRYFHQE